MEFKIMSKERFSEFKENAQTARIDKLRKEYNEFFGVMEFTKALKCAFRGFLDVYQAENKQNETIATTLSLVLSELINIYRLQLGLTKSEIDEYGYFPATVTYLKSKGISQHRMATASKWLIDWNILEVKYEQHPNRPDFKKRYFKINLDVLEKALPREEE